LKLELVTGKNCGNLYHKMMNSLTLRKDKGNEMDLSEIVQWYSADIQTG
jgi:hypothetical protein